MDRNKKNSEILAELKANPLRSDGEIADEYIVSRNVVRRIRKENGLVTARRVRYRDGKAHVYRVKQSPDANDEFPGISCEILRGLHQLRLDPNGQEALQLITDILEISNSEGRTSG